MSHKVHPKAFRIKGISNWHSRGFYGKKPKKQLEEDFVIRQFLTKKLKDCSIEKIEIERFLDKLNIVIESARPAFIIGRAGKGIEQLKQDMENKIFAKRPKEEQKKINIEVKGIREPWSKAGLAAEWIAFRLEKRFPYRRTLKQALEKIMANKEIKGARVEVKGRLDGIEIARKEWLKTGLLPRQTLRADIDYGTAEAFCPYGVVGVKVWIYRGEKFE